MRRENDWKVRRTWRKMFGKKFDLFDLEMRTEKEKEENSWEEKFLVQEYEGKRQIFGSKNRRGRRTKKVNRNFIRYQDLLFIIFLVYFPCHSLRGNIYFLIHIFRNYLSVGNNSHHFPYFCVINSRYQFLQIVCCHGLHLRDKDQLLKHPLAVSRIFFLFNFSLKVWLLILKVRCTSFPRFDALY